MSFIKKHSPIIITLVVLFTFRLITNNAEINGGLTYDTGNVTLGIIDYSLEEERPHLPGYYVHVMFARMFLPIAKDPSRALLWVSWIYSFLGFLLLYVLLSGDKRGEIHPVILCLLVYTNPLVWYYTSVSEMYSFDLFYPLLLLYLCKTRWGVLLIPAVMGILTGVRPSSTVLLIGLYLWIYISAFKKKELSLRSFCISHIFGGITFLLWFYPMVQSCGGFDAYRALYQTNNPVEQITLLQNIFRFSSFACYFLPVYLVSIIVMLVHKKRLNDWKGFLYKATPGLFWLIPPLLFFIFMHYSKGYFMLIAVPVLLMPVLTVKMKKVTLISLIIFQSALFLFLPHNPPSVESSIKREKRNVTLWDTWRDRTTSVFLMGNNRIAGESALQKEIMELVGDSQQEVFVGPSIHIPTRLLQVRLPYSTLWDMDKRVKGRYVWYAGIEIGDTLNMTLAQLPPSRFLMRNSFVEKYLPESLGRVELKSNSYSIMVYSSEDKETLDSVCKELFLR